MDNHEAGGVVAPADENGVLRAALDGSPARRTYATHPDTGRQIEGVQLPLFREAMALATSTLDAFPKTRFAGMDVAMSTSGPTVLELNNYPGLSAAAYLNLPVARLFSRLRLAPTLARPHAL